MTVHPERQHAGGLEQERERHGELCTMWRIQTAEDTSASRLHGKGIKQKQTSIQVGLSLTLCTSIILSSLHAHCFFGYFIIKNKYNADN